MIGYVVAALGGALLAVAIGFVLWIRVCYRMWTES